MKSIRTDRELAALKPGDKWLDVNDAVARNLAVRVGPRTARGDFTRTFIFTARFPGSTSPTRHALGRYPEMSLETARERAADFRKAIRAGLDPREPKAALVPTAPATTLGVVAEEYLRRRVAGQRQAAKTEREIRREILAEWADRPFASITRADVVGLLEGIADRPAPALAHLALSHLRGLFNWAIERGKYGIETSPCDRVRPASIIGPKEPRQRVLDDKEVRALWIASGRLGAPYDGLYRLLLLTGARLSEIAELRWREADLAKRRLVIPPERFKTNVTHLIPLCDEAMAIVEGLQRANARRSGDGFLFSFDGGQTAVNSFSAAKRALDTAMLDVLRESDPQATLKPFVNHDIRRTVRTRLSGLRVPEHVAERVIGHGAKGIARVYDIHQYEAETRDALERWAAALAAIVSPPPPNVIALPARSG